MIRDKINALFSAVKAVFAEMKSAESDKGIIYYDDDEIKIGTILYSDNGVITEGEFIIGGNKVKVENGSVSEIEAIEEKPMEEPNPVEGEMSCGDKEKMSDVKVEEEPEEKKENLAEEEPKEEPKEESVEDKAEEEKIRQMVTDIVGEIVAPIFGSIEELRNQCVKMDAKIVEIAGEPEAKEPKEEFKKVYANDKTAKLVEALANMSKK